MNNINIHTLYTVKYVQLRFADTASIYHTLQVYITLTYISGTTHRTHYSFMQNVWEKFLSIKHIYIYIYIYNGNMVIYLTSHKPVHLQNF